MGEPSSFFYWWQKLASIWSDIRTYICLIILQSSSFFSKSFLIILHSNSFFWCYKWLTVENFVLIVVSKYLPTVKQSLPIVLFQKVGVFGMIFIRWSKNKHKNIEKIKMLKMLAVNSFLTYSHKYIKNFLWKSGLTIPIFLKTRKTCKI